MLTIYLLNSLLRKKSILLHHNHQTLLRSENFQSIFRLQGQNGRSAHGQKSQIVHVLINKKWHLMFKL